MGLSHSLYNFYLIFVLHNAEKIIAGLHLQNPRHFARQPSAQVSQHCGPPTSVT